MSESKMWQGMKPKLPGTYQRFEDALSPGIADVNWLYNGKEVWIELKYKPNIIKVARKRNTGLEPEQGIWLRERKRYGGNVFLLIKCGSGADTQWWLFDDYFTELARPKLDPEWLHEIAADIWYGAFDWERIWNRAH